MTVTVCESELLAHVSQRHSVRRLLYCTPPPAPGLTSVVTQSESPVNGECVVHFARPCWDEVQCMLGVDCRDGGCWQ